MKQRPAEAAKRRASAGAEPGGPSEGGPSEGGLSEGGFSEGGPSGYGGLKEGLKAMGDSGAPFWWDRGYQVHIESHHLIQHVTFRLADSLPHHVVAEWDAELKGLPPMLRNPEKQKRLNAYLDAGHGGCILREPAMAQLVQDTLLHFHGQRYTMHAWCVMPNHVHVLFQPAGGHTMSSIITSWKAFTGKRIGEFARERGLATAVLPPPSAPGRVWHREYWDRYIRDHAHYVNTVNYIHENPVQARLVAKAEDWKWSTAYLAAQGRGEPNEDALLGRSEPSGK
jgi:REP element-mobilizing transposase RayT